MEPEESQPNPAVTSLSSQPSQSGPQPAESPAEIKPGLHAPLWLLTLAAGVIVGVVSGQSGEATNSAIGLDIHYPADFASLGGYQKTAVVAMITGDAWRIAVSKRCAAAYGLLGILLGVSLGLVGGWAIGSFRSGLWGVIIGAVAGGAAGAGLSAIVVPIFFRFQNPETDASSMGLLLLFLAHATIFAGIGATSGLALAWGSGNRKLIVPALVGGALGAVFGTFAFELINSLLYPLVRTYEPMPSEAVPRILIHVCAAMGTAFGAALAVGGGRGRTVFKRQAIS
jgi:hypothetical protein